jgi:hypothetical protein
MRDHVRDDVPIATAGRRGVQTGGIAAMTLHLSRSPRSSSTRHLVVTG